VAIIVQIFIILFLAHLLTHPLFGQELEPKPVHILFGSCLDPRKPHHILSVIADKNPDLFIFLGDNIYADTSDRDIMEKRYRELGESPLFQKLQTLCPTLAVWDDHDYGKNDAGAGFSSKDMSRGLFLDFWGVPQDSPRRAHRGIYHAVEVGPVNQPIQIILLDTRYFRSPLKRGSGAAAPQGPYTPLEGSGVTLLGEEQWRWLEKRLTVPASLHIIASSIQVLTEYHGWESWANFPEEQSRLLNLVNSSTRGNVVFISGDRHFSELSARPINDTYTLYDLTSSGLNRRYPLSRPNANRHRRGEAYLLENFGSISVGWGNEGTSVTLSLFDAGGREVLRQELSIPH
jgi:alkaline phosphatase D